MKTNSSINPYNPFRRLYLIGFFLILSLPLLNLPPWFSPPDWGKTVVLRIVTSCLLFLFLWQIASAKNSNALAPLVNRSRAAKTYFLLAAFIGLSFLAVFFSADTAMSLWGTPYRAGGFVNLLCLFTSISIAFLVIQKKDWQKLLSFHVVIAILVSIVALAQKFGFLGYEFFAHFSDRPPSTVGGPIFLAIYLLLSGFPVLGFVIREKRLPLRIFYLAVLLLFLFTVIHTETRAVYIGLALGLLYFILAYPQQLRWLKLSALALAIIGLAGFFVLKANPQLYSFTSGNGVERIINRVLSISGDPSRISAWKIGLTALKAKPIFGYGPENFSIGFDRYYDPSLPEISIDPETKSSWWDRAHNFLLDISVTTGIPSLIVHLLFFAVLFWQLEKTKRLSPDDRLATHALQAGFLSYFIADFFSFDTLSTQIALFFLIAYSLRLILENEALPEITAAPLRLEKFLVKLNQQRKPVLATVGLMLLWFVWDCNLKPFNIVTEINKAKILCQNNRCASGMKIMDKLLTQRGIVDSYVRTRYVDFVKVCADQLGENELDYVEKGRLALKENTVIRPTFTRNWLYLGELTSYLLERTTDEQQKLTLASEADQIYRSAELLSPKRQEVYLGWIKADLLAGNYPAAVEKAQKCIDLNTGLGNCFWLMGLSQIFNGDSLAGQKYIELAATKDLHISWLDYYNQLATAYAAVEDYPNLAKAYEELAYLDGKSVDYRAQLAAVYKELGEYGKARIAALDILRIDPEYKAQVDEFLKTLPK